MSDQDLIGQRVEVLHNRGGASRFGGIAKVGPADSIWVLMDEESAPIHATLDVVRLDDAHPNMRGDGDFAERCDAWLASIAT